MLLIITTHGPSRCPFIPPARSFWPGPPWPGWSRPGFVIETAAKREIAYTFSDAQTELATDEIMENLAVTFRPLDYRRDTYY